MAPLPAPPLPAVVVAEFVGEVLVMLAPPVVVELPDAPPLRALAWKEMESSERLEGVEQVSLPGTARMFAQRWG